MSFIIKKQNNNIFNVTVSDNTITQHKVTVSDDVHRDLTNNCVSKESLVEFSFRFLLAREPNTSILSSFDVSVISRYFSDYKNEVRKWCDGV